MRIWKNRAPYAEASLSGSVQWIDHSGFNGASGSRNGKKGRIIYVYLLPEGEWAVHLLTSLLSSVSERFFMNRAQIPHKKGNHKGIKKSGFGYFQAQGKLLQILLWGQGQRSRNRRVDHFWYAIWWVQRCWAPYNKWLEQLAYARTILPIRYIRYTNLIQM